MKKLNHIWIFSDSIKGHEIQSQALAVGLAKNVQLFHCSIRQPWLSFAPRILPRFGRNIIWEKNAPDCDNPPDAIITCGRRMAAIGKYFKRLCQCKHIQILNPGDDDKKYDLLICPEHDGLKGKNVISTQGSLHGINAERLNQKKNQCQQQSSEFSNKTIALLLGNPDKGFYKKLDHLAEHIKQYCNDADLYVCGSRRTHKRYHNTIKQQFNFANNIWLAPVDGNNPYQCLLACSDAFIVTADSINMLSETCATDKVVIAIGEKYISPKHQKFIASISDRLDNFDEQTYDIKPLNTLEQALTEIEKLID